MLSTNVPISLFYDMLTMDLCTMSLIAVCTVMEVFRRFFFLFCFYYIYFQLKGNVAEGYKTLSLIMIVIVIVEWDHGWLLIGEQ